VFSAVGGALADGSRHLNTDVISWTLREVAPDVRCVAIVGDRGIDISEVLTTAWPASESDGGTERKAS